MNRDTNGTEWESRPTPEATAPATEPIGETANRESPTTPPFVQVPPFQAPPASTNTAQTSAPNPGAPSYGQPSYYAPSAPHPYAPQPNQVLHSQPSYYGGQYGAGAPYGAPYAAPRAPQYAPVPKPKAEKKGASKGFVVGMMALGMVFSLLVGLVGGAALSDGNAAPSGKGSVIIQHVPKDEDEAPVTDKGVAAYVTSVAAPAVVEVTTETVSNNQYYGQYVETGAGSGVIISSGEEGSYIITCAHVIEGATTVTVKLKDGTEHKAAFTASDAQTDIGVIRIDVKGLPTVTLGDFSKVVVGEEVVAIGNPLGELGGSVTNGIISALDRDVIIDGTTYNLLQTNAEINPGNSGGGLFNAKGELIGIVNAKSGGENVEGLGFAIPIDDAETVATELIENGYVTGRVKLGFNLIEVATQADVQYWWKYSKYFSDYGIYIIESENKQFQTGDRLLAIDSETVDSLSELKGMLLKFEVGQTVRVTVSRMNFNTGKAELHDFDLVLTEKTA
ncbi:MAG: trypsin-like peptidase domain-containing protein [Clostridia bacterium]|nr:trypsin-like peptidase domain-containing protein [Clostridia bacterium]